MLTVLELLDLGSVTAVGRPFDPVTDWRYLGSATGLLRDSLGAAQGGGRRGRCPRPGRRGAGADAAVGAAADPARRSPRGPPRRPSSWRSARAGCCRAALGLQASPGVPVASTGAAGLAVDAGPPGPRRPARPRAVRPGGRGRPLPGRSRGRAADRAARQGRAARLRGELRAGGAGGPGADVRGGRGAGRRHAAAGRGRLSRRPARSSRRRRSAGSAGSPTPRCSPGCGWTASVGTTTWWRATASRSATRSAGPAGGPSATSPRTGRTGRRAGRSTTTTSCTTPATWGTAARRSATPRCPTSTPSRRSGASS